MKISNVCFVISTLLFTYAFAAEVKWSGDLRYRTRYSRQSVSASSGGGFNLDQGVRARMGLSAKIDDSLTAVIRGGTIAGANSPARFYSEATTNTFSSMTVNIESGGKPYFLDRMYFRYRLKDDLELTFGKSEFPWWQANSHGVAFSDEAMHDGVAVQYIPQFGDFKPFVIGSYHSIAERGFDVGDSFMSGVQLGGTWVNDQWFIKLAIAQMSTTSLAGKAMYTDSGSGTVKATGDYGAITNNSVTCSTSGTTQTCAYNYEYRIQDIEFESGMSDPRFPWSVFIGYLTNSAAENGQKNALVSGFRWGDLNEVGAWRVSYEYRDIKRDAIWGGIADSTFAGGKATDIKGHRMVAAYQWKAGVTITGYISTAQTDLYNSNTATPGSDFGLGFDRYFVQLDAKF